MKKLVLTYLLILNLSFVYSQSIGIIELDKNQGIENLSENKAINIHYFTNKYALIAGEVESEKNGQLVDKDGFNSDYLYYIHYYQNFNKEDIQKHISNFGEILFSNNDLTVFKCFKENFRLVKPYCNDALVYISPEPAILPKAQKNIYESVSYNNNVDDLINKVSKQTMSGTINKLQSYMTRDWYNQQSKASQQWVSSQFSSFGYSVESMSLSNYGNVSPNIIAKKKGISDPDKYVVVGGHGDSYSYSGDAPGADDNASGVAGVIEIARILKDVNFDYSIIFCSFSGEEYGLFGSYEYAKRAADNKMDIIGYVNLDMISYTSNENYLHTDLIFPSSAKSLADYYTNIVDTYIDDFSVEIGQLSGGDSDHTSFNKFGFKGIFPFEDTDDYSPYIHTSNDIMGLSANSMNLAEKFTQAALATVASLAVINTSLDNDDVAKDSPITIFPNPATDYIRIGLKSNQEYSLKIYNVVGSLVQETTRLDSEKIDISKLNSGVYLVEVNTKDYKSIQKIIKK